MSLIQKVIRRLPKDIMVVVGGTIPKEDVTRLKSEGVSEVFLPVSRLDAIVDYIKQCKVSLPREVTWDVEEKEF